MKNRAIFFDRDDTLIKNVPYLGDPSKVELMPYAQETLARLRSAGFLLFVVSNQSGVGRGYITLDQVHAVNQEMIHQLGDSYFTEIYSAYSAPGAAIDDGRKPSPKLLFDAAIKHELDLKNSFFIGDRLSDIQCARNAECNAILILSGDYHDEKPEASALSHFVAHSLQKAADWILDNTISPC